MRQINRLQNILRNACIRTPVGRIFINTKKNLDRSICFISATRLPEKQFWNQSQLGRSLAPHLDSPFISARISFDNSRGLPDIYNEAIQSGTSDILVFLHDDVWLSDPEIFNKIRTGLIYNDVIGIAGNIRRSPRQPAWAFIRNSYGNFLMDKENLSGVVRHGTPEKNSTSNFGHSPAACELLDGLFLAANRNTLTQSNVYFDNRFKFDFYDLDFCRTARLAGLSLSTWPIDVIHLSPGAINSPSWKEVEKQFFEKWEK